MRSGTTQVRLWLVSETEKAWLYSKVPTNTPGRKVHKKDQVWVAKSLVEHRTKVENEHVVTLPDWFVEKNL